jgi:hypothetical protein
MVHLFSFDSIERREKLTCSLARSALFFYTALHV